jgi:pimeloyl-ACP methyl ester carboxylesterase
VIEKATVEVDGVRTFLRRKPGEGVPTLFVHGNPSHSADWIPFLDRVGGPAIALDLPGWGRSERPGPERFDGTMHGLATFVNRFLDAVGIDEHKLVVHDWGVVALIAAQRDPERVRRLVIIDVVPLLPGYRWHWVARLWRRRWIGEAVNATSTRAGFALGMRQARADRGPMPSEFIDMIWETYDRGTRRAILKLYRSADEATLGTAGSRQSELTCPALVVWGTGDPYLPARFARDYARVLPNAELVELEDAGHWPWLERPDVVDRVAAFLDAR